MATDRRTRVVRIARIAVSAVCGLLCVLLIMLWVRSYWVIEAIGRGSRTPTDRTLVSISSNNGTLGFSRLTVPAESSLFVSLTEGWSYQTARPQFAAKQRFSWGHTREGFKVQFPTWLPAILLASIGVLPWMDLQWQFSLRCLLIATTLVAVVLGLAVWAAR